MQTERTLVLIKPDGVRRGLVGEVLRRIESRGFALVALDVRVPDRGLLDEHYAEHVEKPFYPAVAEFMQSGPVVAAVVEGHGVVDGWRAMMGATDPMKAAPGTVRGDLGREWGTPAQQNIAHGSDSAESAAREIALWFPALASR